MIVVTLDKFNDVLYVKKENSKILHSNPVPGDNFVIINYNNKEDQVGLQIIEISLMTADLWEKHFKDDISEELFESVQKYLIRRDSN